MPSVVCKNVGVVVDFELLKRGFAVVFHRPKEQCYDKTKA